MKIAVSILKSNFSEEETIKKINETDAEYIHLDIADGHFVKEITPEREYLHLSKKPLHVHLMVSDPFNYISKYAVLNTSTIIVPFELDIDLKDTLNYIKMRGMSAGIALNPETSIVEIKDYLDLVDEIIVMTVTPGQGGQSMLDDPLKKIEELCELREKKSYKYKIIADGGVNADTISKVKLCDMVIAGSYICSSDDFQERINKLRL